MKNAYHPRPSHPFVERNPFIGRAPQVSSIPAFAEAKTKLPEPVLAQFPEWVALYWRAWEIIWSNLRQPNAQNGFAAHFVAPVGHEYWLMWDCVILIQLGLLGRCGLSFVEMSDNLYAKQLPDGFIGQAFHIGTGEPAYMPFDPNSTGPNLLSINEWRYFRITGDDGRFEKVFWPLLALHEWYRDNRTWPDGAYWATGISSHLANQPRVPDSRNHHRHWSWIDATVQAALDSTCLAQIAAHLNEDELSAQLHKENQQLTNLINDKFWNEEAQFFQDVSPDGRFSRIKSAAAYWTLLLPNDSIPPKRVSTFIQPLRENWAFNLPHRIPSMSADSEGYNADSGNQYRGGIWPCLNYMILRGLRAHNQHALAHSIAVNHLTQMQKVYLDTGYFWDNYAPETPAPGKDAQKNSVTACITPIATLLEDVIGIGVDWPHRRVAWDRHLQTDQPYGVRNYPLGEDGVLEMIGDNEKVTVTTNTPFTLTIRDTNQRLQTAVGIGTTVIDLD